MRLTTAGGGSAPDTSAGGIGVGIGTGGSGGRPAEEATLLLLAMGTTEADTGVARSVEATLQLDAHTVTVTVVAYSAHELHVAAWWPLLMGLVDLVTDRRLDVRIKAVQTLLGAFYVVSAVSEIAYSAFVKE